MTIQLAYIPYATSVDLHKAIQSLACPTDGHEVSEKNLLIETCLLRKPLLLKQLYVCEIAILKNNPASLQALRESRKELLEELKIISLYEK